MKRKMYFLIAVSLMSLLVGAAIAHAQGPQPGGNRAPGAPAGNRLTYQGRLTDSSGAPLNSTVNMVFKLYDSSSVLLWTSATRSVMPVNGLFTVYLGDGSDPDLGEAYLIPAATIGVTVGGDPEMTPRQPLNTVVGHSESGDGVIGFSNGNVGVYGYSNGFVGVYGDTTSLTGQGVFAHGAGPSGIALRIQNGGIKVYGAGVDTTTPVFLHQVTVGGAGDNVCAPFGSTKYATVVDNPLTNGDPNAILIVTPNFRNSDGSQSNASGPAKDIPALFYSVSGGCGNIGKWVIYNLSSTAMVNNTYYNVMVIKP